VKVFLSLLRVIRETRMMTKMAEVVALTTMVKMVAVALVKVQPVPRVRLKRRQ
jgi:hypothetical protein